MRKYSKEWVLQDTINFYTLENRAIDKFVRCHYFMEDGKRCAIGRFLKKGKEDHLRLCSSSVDKFIEISVFQTIIPVWMKKTSVSFLTRIQLLHDTSEFWTTTGLNEFGISQVKSICEDFNIDFNSLTVKI